MIKIVEFIKKLILRLKKYPFIKKRKMVLFIEKQVNNEIIRKDSYDIIKININIELSDAELEKILLIYKKSSYLIISHPLPTLAQKSTKEFIEFIKAIDEFLNSNNSLFKKRIKLYLEFSEAQELLGFNDFFRSADNGLVGICIDPSMSKNKSILMKHVLNAFNNLLTQAESSLIAKISSSDGQVLAQKLYLSIQQLKFLSPRITKFIEHFLTLKLGKLNFRLLGIHLSSRSSDEFSQSFMPINFINYKTPIPIQYSDKKRALKSSLFIKSASESINLNSMTDDFKNLIKASQNSLKYLIPLSLLSLSLTLIFLMGNEYYEEKSFSKIADQSLKNFIKIEKLPESSSDHLLLNSLISLNPLLKFNQKIKLLPSSYAIENEIHEKMDPYISKSILQASRSWLEAYLLAPSEINLFYLNFKAYLSLKSDQNSNYLAEALCYYANHTNLKNIDSCLAIEKWIRHKGLKIDQELVNDSEKHLLGYSLADRIYSRLYTHSLLHDKNKRINHSLYKNLFIDNESSLGILTIFSEPYSSIRAELPKLLKLAQKESQFLGLNEEINELWNNYSEEDFKSIYTKNLQIYWKHRLGKIHLKQFLSISNAEEALKLLSNKNSPLISLSQFIQDYAPENASIDLIALENFDYKELNKLLGKLKLNLNSLKSSHDSGEASLKVMSDYLNNTRDSALKDLVEFSKSAPFPLNQWIYEIAYNSWDLISQEALKKINSKWKIEVLSFYNQFIKDRYPLTEAMDEVDLQSFQDFFGPKQRLDTFFSENFSQFIEKKDSGIFIKQIDGLGLNLKKAHLDFWRKSLIIQNKYFDPISGLVSFKLGLKPLTLSRNSRSLKLKHPPQSLVYQHGPQNMIHFNWPNNENELSNISLQLIDFSNHIDELFYTGSWSLFRLLDQAEMEYDPEQQAIRLYYEFPKQSCSLLVTPIKQESLLKLSALKELKLPLNFQLNNPGEKDE